MTYRSLVRWSWYAALLLLAAGLGPGFASVSNAAVSLGSADPTCVGDCDNGGAVTVEELVKGVSIALGAVSLDQCPRFDCQTTGQVTVDCLINAVSAALNGCQSAPAGSPTRPIDTATPTDTSTPTATRPPTGTSTPGPTTIDDAALAAAARVATESIFRLFDLQASLGTAVTAAGRSRTAGDRPTAASGCQTFDCPLFGTHEDCCSGTQFSQFFSNCTFGDDVEGGVVPINGGGVVTLNGLFDLISDDGEPCKGAIPAGASFAASLQNFTRDVFVPGGSFSRTFQEISETFEVAPGGCLVNLPDQFGFGIRGEGRRLIDGEVQHFLGDTRGNIRVDSASQVHGLEIAVDSTPVAEGCAVSAALNGSLTGSDFRVGTQFTTVYTDVHVAQHPQADALDLELTGTLGTDCIGDVTLSTLEPLRVTSGDTCFSDGRLQAQLADATVAATYTVGGEVDLDFGAAGGGDQHFSACTAVPADQCRTTLVGLCGTCTALNQCQGGLACFPCSDNCSGDTQRCALSDTFTTCQDGVF
ncbi:MAG TPA: hypothetical protein VL049_04670 [Candidatus Dormibacteraeota bacterium]|nr:hypothetical protein [Candidatus Dormibacteraeota bacterium]